MMSTVSLVIPFALGLSAVQGLVFPSGQRISEQKCSQYRDATIKKTTLITLSIRPTSIVFEDYKCPNVLELIVGGEEARKGEFPHQALLGYPSEDDPREITFKCGGTLISERYVLSAAHCSIGGKPTVVRLGENNLLDNEDDQVDFDVDEFIRHPEYTPRRAYHDIALVKMAQDVFFTKLIRPACLWTGRSLNFSSAIASGFGRTEFAGSTSDVLMKVQLDVLDKSDCSALTASGKFNQGISDGQMCVGSRAGGKDTCQGDSGGPLVTLTDQKGCVFHLFGITSTGAACGFGKSPSIYTRVAYYIDWIEENVWGSE
ncbi:serine protease snake-like [Toxorhynchites rutilus septentrionalis]|uniref:serine protease snake-like n=1 Tax=Toxorhynchites rutilus septentrionalis TaxID=329112 RepID=UPI00247A52A8|nr:serine protease snake-like [Toxorhynchites rutilus septentrionalis]